MSLIFAGGVRATAKNNIVAAINSFIVPQPDGSKLLDVGAVSGWVMDQLRQMIVDLEYKSRSAAETNIGYVPQMLPAQTSALANVVRREHWIDRATWPRASTQTADDIIAAIKPKLVEVKTLSETITKRHSAFVNVGTLPTFVEDFMGREGVKFNLPPVVTRIVDDRFYIATFVTDRNEESAPCPVSATLVVDQNDSVTVARPQPPGGRSIDRWRLYRSNVGSQSAAFAFVAEMPIDTATYIDTKKASELEEPCPTLTWAEPPATLKGLVGMPNGIMAGFTGNVVAFCEPYYPYAWPVEYQATTESPVVAMASFGQTLVVGTQGFPYYISGADSASMSAQKMQSSQSCASPRSMVGVDGGVVYASPDGLCLADGNGIRVITAGLFTRGDWQKLKPESIVAAYHERTYFWLWNNGTSSGCYALHLDTGKLVTLDLEADALYVDKMTDTLYAARGSYIYAIFSGGEPRTGVWRSKVAVHPRQTSYAWLSVESDFEHPVVVRWFGDGVLRYTATVMTRAPVRLPPGRWLEHEIEIESKARWTAVTFASSSDELRAA